MLLTVTSISLNFPPFSPLFWHLLISSMLAENQRLHFYFFSSLFFCSSRNAIVVTAITAALYVIVVTVFVNSLFVLQLLALFLWLFEMSISLKNSLINLARKIVGLIFCFLLLVLFYLICFYLFIYSFTKGKH